MVIIITAFIARHKNALANIEFFKTLKQESLRILTRRIQAYCIYATLKRKNTEKNCW